MPSTAIANSLTSRNTGFASFKIKLPKVVVCVKAKTQLNPKDTANTINNGFTISATDAGAKYIGKKEHTAIKVAPNNAHRSTPDNGKVPA